MSRNLIIWRAQVCELMLGEPTPGIYVSVDEANIAVVHALCVGPEGTPYEGGFFHFRLESNAAPLCALSGPRSPASALQH